MKYITIDQEYGEHNIHDTEEEAMKDAEGFLQSHRDNSPEGWPEDLTIIVAKVLSQSIMCDRKPVACAQCDLCEDECQCPEFEAEHEWDYTCDYKMETK